jgi:hypothetical protein
VTDEQKAVTVIIAILLGAVIAFALVALVIR